MRSHWRLELVFASLMLLVGCLLVWRYHVTRPAARLHRGQEALARGDAAAAEHLAELLEADGHDDQAHLLRGEVLLRQRQYRRALQELNRIRDQGELRRRALAFSGQCLMQLRELREAERVFLFILSEQPDNLDAHRGLADIFYAQGALRRAVGHLDPVTQLDPDDGRAYWLIGHIFKDLDQKIDALSYIREALARHLTAPLREAAREDLADLLVGQGEYTPALAVLDQCRPAPDQALQLLGLRVDALRGLGRVPEALTLLDGALHEQPGSALLLRRRAELHLEAGDVTAAATLLERAVDHDRHDPRPRHLLAQVYERLGRRADAEHQRHLVRQLREDLQELTRLNREADSRPWDAAVRHRMADICHRIGQQDLAAMWRESAAACHAPTSASP